MRRTSKQTTHRHGGHTSTASNVAGDSQEVLIRHTVDGEVHEVHVVRNGALPHGHAPFDVKPDEGDTETYGQAILECFRRFLFIFTDRFSILSASVGFSLYPMIALLTPLNVRGAGPLYKPSSSIWWTRLTILTLWFATAVFTRHTRSSNTEVSSPIAMEVIITMGRFMVFTTEIVGWSAYSLLADEDPDRGGGGGAGVGGNLGVGTGGACVVGNHGGEANSSTRPPALSRRVTPARSLFNSNAHWAFGGSGGGGAAGAAQAGGFGAGRSRPSPRCYSYCTPGAFFVEQIIWFSVFLCSGDTPSLHATATGLYFASCLWWCNFPVIVNGALAFCYLNAYLCAWIYPPAVRDFVAGPPSVTDGGAAAKIYAAYACSLLFTALLTECNLLSDSRARMVEAITTLPQRALRLTRNAKGAVLVVNAYKKVLSVLSVVDFFFCMSLMLYVSILHLGERATVTLATAVFIVLFLPSLLGNSEEWQLEPALAFADALACVSVYLTVIIFVIACVPVSAMPFLVKAVMAALLTLYAAAHSTYVRQRPFAYMLLFVVLLGMNFCAAGPAPVLPPLIVMSERAGRAVTVDRVTSLHDFWDVIVFDVRYVLSLPLCFLCNWSFVAAAFQYLLVSSVHCGVIKLDERQRLQSEAIAAATAQAASSPNPQTTASPAGAPPVVARPKSSHKAKEPKAAKATSKKAVMSGGGGGAASATSKRLRNSSNPPQTVGRAASLGSVAESVSNPAGSKTSSFRAASHPHNSASRDDVNDTTDLHSDSPSTSQQSRSDSQTDMSTDAVQTAGASKAFEESALSQSDSTDPGNHSTDVTQDDEDGTVSSHLNATANGADSVDVASSDSQVIPLEEGTAADPLPRTTDDKVPAVKRGKNTAAAGTAPEEAKTRTSTQPTTAPSTAGDAAAVGLATTRKQAPAQPPPLANSAKTATGAAKSVAVKTPSPKTPAPTASETRSHVPVATIPLPRSSRPADAKAQVPPTTTPAAGKSPKPVVPENSAGTSRGKTAAPAPSVTTSSPAVSFPLPKPRHEQAAPATQPATTTTTGRGKLKAQPTPTPTSTAQPEVKQGAKKNAVVERRKGSNESGEASAAAENVPTVPLPRSQRAAAAAPAVAESAPAADTAVDLQKEDSSSRGNYFLSFLQPVLDSDTSDEPSPADAALAAEAPNVPHIALKSALAATEVSQGDGTEVSGLSMDVGRLLQWMNDDAEVQTPRAPFSFLSRASEDDGNDGNTDNDNTDARTLLELLSHNSASADRQAPASAAAIPAATDTTKDAHQPEQGTVPPTWSVMPSAGGASTVPLPNNMKLFTTSAPLRRALADELDSDRAHFLPEDCAMGAAAWPSTTPPSSTLAIDTARSGTFPTPSTFSTVPRRQAASSTADTRGGLAGVIGGAAYPSDFTPPETMLEQDGGVRRDSPFPAPHPLLPSASGSSGSNAAFSASPIPPVFAPQYAAGAAANPSTPASSLAGVYYPSNLPHVANSPSTPPQHPQAVAASVVPTMPGNQMALVQLPDGRLSLCPVVYVNGSSFVAAPAGSTVVAKPPQVFYGLNAQSAQPTAGYSMSVSYPQQF